MLKAHSNYKALTQRRLINLRASNLLFGVRNILSWGLIGLLTIMAKKNFGPTWLRFRPFLKISSWADLDLMESILTIFLCTKIKKIHHGTSFYHDASSSTKWKGFFPCLFVCYSHDKILIFINLRTQVEEDLFLFVFVCSHS